MSAARATAQGLAEAQAFVGTIPEAAREQIAVEAAMIGYDVLAAQKRDVAKDTGELAGKLSVQLLLDELRVKVGLIGVSSGRSKAFYGRIVEYGRRARVVLVTRKLKRRVTGNGRATKRRVNYEGKPYKLRVKAMAGRPYVHVDRPEIRAEQRLAQFWSEVLGKAESMA